VGRKGFFLKKVKMPQNLSYPPEWIKGLPREPPVFHKRKWRGNSTRIAIGR